MSKNMSKKTEFLLVLMIFAFGVVLHFVFGLFVKRMETYADELRYFYIAENIYKGNGFQIRGVEYGFQKIFYSLLLSPLFAIENVFRRIQAINLLNSLMMMSSVFPGWLICKKIGLDLKKTLVFCFFLIIWPETFITMTFMSENVYWPLCFWFVYAWLVWQDEKKIVSAVSLGALCFLGYITKEIFLALFLVVVLYGVFELFYERKMDPEGDVKKKVLYLSIFVFTFALFCLIYKLVFFAGWVIHMIKCPSMRYSIRINSFI